jgi:hypothetical protein
LRGGKHGSVVQPGKPEKSELLSRLTLPASDERLMPPQGKPAMSADDITVVKLWIAAGASGTLPVSAIKNAPKPVAKIVFPQIDEAVVQHERAPLAKAVQSVQERFGGIIAYESRGSANLNVNASLLGTSFGDPELQALAPLSERIVIADFSGTSITDASADTIAGMKRLRMLRLANTRVTDATVKALASAAALQSLTVVGADVSMESLAALRGKKVRIYDGKVDRVSPDEKS